MTCNLLGRFDGNGKLKKADSKLTVNSLKFLLNVIQNKSIANDGVEIVLEATGFFAKKEAAENTLHPGASCYHCSWWK